MSRKIEIDILLFMLVEAIVLLFFFKESFLTIILGFILGILLIKLTKNIKTKLTKLLMFIFTLPLGFITFYKIIRFINDNVLKNYSLIIIILPLIFISIYLLAKNYHTFIKSLEISFYFFLIIKIISIILIIPKIDFSNFGHLLNNSFNYHFILIGLIILYLEKTMKYLTNYSINKKRITLSFLNPLLIKTLTILVLGNTLTNIYQYPYVNYLKNIRYFDFIERLDGILVFEYLFSFFYFFVFLLFNIKLMYSNKHFLYSKKQGNYNTHIVFQKY